jgi:N-methylhydantoinase A
MEEATGRLTVAKVATTPEDPSRGIVRGVSEILDGRDPGALTFFGHGTTVATNALIEHRGVETGLITTRGFRDLLELGRQRRPKLYDLQCDKPEPLVRRSRRLEVTERVTYDGAVERPLDEDEVRSAVRELGRAGVGAVAVCFLYSYVRPEHEQLVQRILREELPDVFVSASHDVMPEFREYERLTTTVVNAYLGPIVSRYLACLEPELAGAGVTVSPHITQSNGGVISFATAREHPVRTILSGPSTGLVGAAFIGGMAGLRNLITFDMGGTSTDVALIEDGRPAPAGEAEVSGYPIKAPMLDMNTVGAGGGSIAWIDSGGHLKVGPRSAGAVPGPACYGQGGEDPTVTDANVLLGTLNPTHLLGGRMPIDREAARRAVRRLAEPLGMDEAATAQGILSVVTANMARAIRVISVQRGHDPRDYTLVAFGGAGPLHAVRLARELEIPRVLVPQTPGVLCALGLLVSDLRTNYSLTRLLPAAEASVDAVRDAFAGLERRARGWFDRERIPEGRRTLERTVDMRYAGQNYELGVEMPDGDVSHASMVELVESFHRSHERMYGYAATEEPVQMVTFRLEARGLTPRATIHPEAQHGEDPGPALVSERRVHLPEAGGEVACPVYDRARLRPGNRLRGPAVVEQMDSTTVILPGDAARVDPYRNLVLEVGR